MGKPTGFLEFERKDNTSRQELERIQNFCEFHPPLSDEERKNQAARCMDCGVPFCQSAMKIGGAVSGCPLHNLIPEFNDALCSGSIEHAYARLHKTASFPEFTGRVCPALCEAACSNGLYGKPVTIRENELAIIEKAFSEGLVRPEPPKVRSGKRIAVVGSGPAGLACADRLNRRGHSVTVFEKSDRIGGLLMYGIPNMKLDKKIVQRRVELMQKEGISFVTDADVGNGVDANELRETFDAVVLCCGAGEPRDLTPENRNAKGVYFAVDFLTETTRCLLNNGKLTDGNYISAKNRNVIVVGGGDTGNDCVATCIRHGCKSVTQLELMPKLPDSRAENNPWPQWPRICKTDYGQQEAIAVFGKDPRVYETTVKRLITDKSGKLTGAVTVKMEQKKDPDSGRMLLSEVAGSEKTLKADLLIIAAGFLGPRPYVPQAFGVKCTQRSTVETLPNQYATNVPGVFCAGDMHRGQSLVVWAIAEGRAAAKEVDEYLMGYTNLI